jgi:hypothetical protein
MPPLAPHRAREIVSEVQRIQTLDLASANFLALPISPAKLPQGTAPFQKATLYFLG